MKNMEINGASNNTSYSPANGLPSKVEGIAFCSAFGLVAVIVFVGNSLTIFLFSVHNKLHKKSLFLIINMAFADLIVGAVCLPMYIYLSLGNHYRLWSGEVDMSVHIFYGAINTIFSTISILSAPLISVERIYAIYRPLKYRTLSTREYCIVIIIAWTLAILISTVFIVSVLLISRKYAYFALTSFYLSLLLIVCGCNIGIWRNFKRGSVASQPWQKNRAAQNQRLTHTLLFVSTASLLSWIPLIVIQYLRYNSLNVSSVTFYLAVVFNYSNSFFNPLVYALRIPEFKQALDLCFFRGQKLMSGEDNEDRDNRAAALTPVIQLRILPTDPSHLQLAFEQEILDTKL